MTALWVTVVANTAGMLLNTVAIASITLHIRRQRQGEWE